MEKPWSFYIETMRDMYINQHLTMAEIGRQYKISRAYVSQLFKKYDVDVIGAERFNATCDICGHEYSITRAKFRKRRKHYCSTGCYHRARHNPNYNQNRNGQRIARKVYSAWLGRLLNETEVIHHIDGNTMNNELSNLMLFANNADHIAHHHSLRINKQWVVTSSAIET